MSLTGWKGTVEDMVFIFGNINQSIVKEGKGTDASCLVAMRVGV